MTDQPWKACLRLKIIQKDALVGVIGLGYVGLPVAATIADEGFRVIGIDIDTSRVEAIGKGANPIEGDEPGLTELISRVVGLGRLRTATDYAELSRADVVLIDVETPVDESHTPLYEALRSACRSLGEVMQPGSLVVIESTVGPGTTDKVARPLLEEHSNLTAGGGFLLGVCPERVMPGRLLSNLRNMSRICGGTSQETAETMAEFYRHFVDAEIDVTDTVTAELVKTAENTYRDVQIAFANELALVCEVVGADVWRVRELVNKVPAREVHFPGAGVGGHCIPKDPWLLVHSAADQVPLRLIPEARAVNDSMPSHVANLVKLGLAQAGAGMAGARVLVLGYAYLENSDDARNSPSEILVRHLREMGAEVRIHDPWIAELGGDLEKLATGCDAAVLMVAHDEYREIDLLKLRSALKTPVLVDGRNVFDREVANAAGLLFLGIGQGQKA